jgi:Mn-dependent DtxR family transcriptional regulator
MTCVSHYHRHLTASKQRLIDAVHTGGGALRTADVAAAAHVSLDYAGRMLGELHAEGLIERSRDPEYHGRGQAPYIWSCCES